MFTFPFCLLLSSCKQWLKQLGIQIGFIKNLIGFLETIPEMLIFKIFIESEIMFIKFDFQK